MVLQSVFPGLWLSSITPDAYRVSDTPAKVVMIVYTLANLSHFVGCCLTDKFNYASCRCRYIL